MLDADLESRSALCSSEGCDGLFIMESQYDVATYQLSVGYVPTAFSLELPMSAAVRTCVLGSRCSYQTSLAPSHADSPNALYFNY